MKKITLLLLLFGIAIHAWAQERTIIQGYCKDENGKAIENVSVYVHDSLLVSVTDEQGRFTYGFAKEGMRLRFAHMVFEPTYYTIKEKDINGKNLTVSMKTKSHELVEVELSPHLPRIPQLERQDGARPTLETEDDGGRGAKGVLHLFRHRRHLYPEAHRPEDRHRHLRDGPQRLSLRPKPTNPRRCTVFHLSDGD